MLYQTNNSANINFIQNGTGAKARTVESRLRDTINVFDFMTEEEIADVQSGSLLIDVSDAVQDAADFALINNRILYAPAGRYKTTKTIDFSTVGLVGDGLGTQFYSVITNGDPTLKFTTPNSYWLLENISVWSAGTTGSYQNCTGVEIGGPIGSTDYANRYHVKNLLVHGCSVGATVNGFIGELDIFVQYCETGVNGNQVNAASVRLKIEQCENAGSFTTCVGSNFHIMFEGGTVLVNGFNWDGCLGCTWTAPYLETLTTGMNLAYFMKFGSTIECDAVKIVGGSTFGGEVTDCYWIFDRVSGLDVDQHWCVSNMSTSLGRHVRTTTNTKRINKLGFRFNTNSGAWICDNSLSPRPYKNLVCNSDFRAGFKGFRSVGTVASAIMSVENTITRGTGTAAKIAAPAGATSSSVGGFFRLSDALLNAYKGKTLGLGVWLYVPDIPEYDSFANKSPAIGLNDGVGATLSTGGYLQKGQWNLLHLQRTLSASASELTIFAYPMNYASGYTATGNEFVVVGEIFLINAASEVDFARLASGYVSEDGGSGIVLGENVMIPGTTIPSGSLMQWKVGDRVVNSNPSVGQPKSWVCTVAGSPGTWVSEGNL